MALFDFVDIGSALLAKFRQENNELRDRIAELSTSGFEGDQSTVGSLAAIARLAEEAETYSAKIEVEKRKISEMEKNLRESEMSIKKNRDAINLAPSDSELRKKVSLNSLSLWRLSKELHAIVIFM